ncbi:gag_pre-integrs domain-containing protein [Trichonephila clavipes]|nr:gag_pre-integrs domain-containing protein [Trichonephila clavipes]
MASKHCLSLVKFPISFGEKHYFVSLMRGIEFVTKTVTKRLSKNIQVEKPSVLHLIPFGCLAYAGVPKQIRKKFDMRAKMGIMMGYAQRTKGYRTWLIDENKLVETINVRYIFDKNKRGINFRQKVNSNLGYNLNLPDYYDDEDDFDRVKDSLTSRLVSKARTETPSTSEKPDVSSDNRSVAAVDEWYRYRTVACFVTGSSPVPLKTRRVGQRCTLNLSRAETSSRWCGVVVRRGGCQLRCRPRHLTVVQNYVVRRQKSV